MKYTGASLGLQKRPVLPMWTPPPATLLVMAHPRIPHPAMFAIVYCLCAIGWSSCITGWHRQIIHHIVIAWLSQPTNCSNHDKIWLIILPPYLCYVMPIGSIRMLAETIKITSPQISNCSGELIPKTWRNPGKQIYPTTMQPNSKCAWRHLCITVLETYRIYLSVATIKTFQTLSIRFYKHRLILNMM